MAGVTRLEVPIMINLVGEPTLALRSFIHKFSSHRVPRARAEEKAARKREGKDRGRARLSLPLALRPVAIDSRFLSTPRAFENASIY